MRSTGFGSSLVAMGVAFACGPASGQFAESSLNAKKNPVRVPRTLAYTEVQDERGIGAYTMAPGLGAGVSAADFDNDGDVDLFVPQRAGHPNQLYRNLGDGSFEEIGLAAGVASSENARSALWVDLDADGLLDLVVMFDIFQQEGLVVTHGLRLYRQTTPGVFAEETIGSGLETFPADSIEPHGGALAAGDLTGDGLPDLVATIWDGGVRVYENLGSGVLDDISDQTGLASTAGTYWQPLLHDVDRDGHQDIFLAHDFAPNRLLINDGVGNFTNQAAARGVDFAFNEMGATFGDCDNDGDLDLYNTNLTRTVFTTYQYCTFFENLGDGLFTETAQGFGVDRGGFGWGAVFFDADNDGRLDLAEVNSLEPDEQTLDHWKLWLNRGPQVGTPVYLNAEGSAGFDFFDAGSALLSVDLERDGDLDLVANVHQGVLRVLESNARSAYPSNSWVTIRPRMPGTNNTRALGAMVRVVAGGIERTRLIHAGTSFMGQEPAEAHFGLGEASAIDSVTVEWPDGTVTVLTGQSVNGVIDIVPVQPGLSAPKPGRGFGRWIESLRTGR